MKVANTVAWIGLLAMTAVILNGFVNGDFGRDGSALLANPWGVVSLVDLYVGFALFSLWIGFREASKLAAVIWIVMMMVLGFFTASLYVILVVRSSRGDWLTFFLGNRKEELVRPWASAESKASP